MRGRKIFKFSHCDLRTNWSCLKVLLATSLWLNMWASTEAILPLVMLHPATIDSFLSLKAIRPGVLTGVLGVAKLLPVYKILKKVYYKGPFFLLKERKSSSSFSIGSWLFLSSRNVSKNRKTSLEMSSLSRKQEILREFIGSRRDQVSLWWQ